MTPRDTTTSSGLVGAARLFSNIVSPPVMFIAVGLAAAFSAGINAAAVRWAILYVSCIALLPLLYILYGLRTGRILDVSMARDERHLPYLIGFVGALLAWLAMRAGGAPDQLRCVTLFTVLGLGSLGLINTAWQISHHAASSTGMTLLLGAMYGPGVGWALVPLVLLVWAARIYLRRHTPAQVAAGALVSVIMVWVTLTYCAGI